jgi:hypothetical protein
MSRDGHLLLLYEVTTPAVMPSLYNMMHAIKTPVLRQLAVLLHACIMFTEMLPGIALINTPQYCLPFIVGKCSRVKSILSKLVVCGYV